MKIIAESSSTRTEWAIVENDKVISHAVTAGINPFFQSRREISHSVRLELPDAFFKKRWKHIYYYGAGCSNADKCKVVESSLVAQFRSPVTVESDLLGAARGLLVRNSGVACIIGTGSNSCVYNGEEIVNHVRPLGYLLGDEGSGSYIGKKFIGDMLKGIAPDEITTDFFKTYAISPDEVIDNIYEAPMVSVELSKYSMFLENYKSHPYVDRLVYNAFINFFERNVASYHTTHAEIDIVGKTAVRFEDILRRAARDSGFAVSKIIPSSLPGLVEYHKND